MHEPPRPPRFRDITRKPRESLRQRFMAALRNPNENEQIRKLPAALRIVLGLVILIVLGTGLLMLPVMHASENVGLSEAFFTAVSALTVTGLSVVTTSTDYTFAGQLVILGLIQVGGVGYMFIATAAMRLIGRRISLLDRLALSSSLGLNTPEAIILILRQVLFGIIIVEGIGAIALYLHWSINDIVPADKRFFYAIFHAISAFCNAGFDLFSGQPEFPNGIPNDEISLIILGSLIFLGGLGIPIFSELVTWQKKRGWSLHFRVNMLVIAGLVLAGWLGIFLAESGANGVLATRPWHVQLITSLFQSVSARTAGFAGLPDFGNITPASQLLIMVLMFIGCAPASMGGGITTGTFSVIGLMLLSYARNKDHVEAFNRRISANTVRRAGAVLAISVGLVMLATFLILLTHPHLEVGETLFEVISAFATCGLTLGMTGELNEFGRVIIALMIFWGRLGALTIVIAVSQVSKSTQLVSYPEEPILIG
jgi:trk system potassium uptake protein